MHWYTRLIGNRKVLRAGRVRLVTARARRSSEASQYAADAAATKLIASPAEMAPPRRATAGTSIGSLLIDLKLLADPHRKPEGQGA
jgi:hypothetical protein